MSRKASEVPRTVAKALAFAHELVQQVSESGIQGASDSIVKAVPVVETETVLLTANLERAERNAATARAQFDKLRAAAESVAEKQKSTLINVRKEWEGKIDSWRMTASQDEAATAKVSEEASAEVIKVRPDRDCAAACHHVDSLPIRRTVEAHKKRKGRAADVFSKLRKVYDEGRKV